MSFIVHRWPRDGSPGSAETHHTGPAAVAAARVSGAISVIASDRDEPVRRPTRWEAAYGRVFITATARKTLGGVPLPHGLNSMLAVLSVSSMRRVAGKTERSRKPPASRPVPLQGPSQAHPSPERRDLRVGIVRPSRPPGVFDLAFTGDPRSRKPRVNHEREIVAALEAGGGPIFERESGLMRHWSSRRDRAIRSGSRAAYCGHGLWVLLGRDIPVDPHEAQAVCLAARSYLWLRGTTALTNVFDALRGRGGIAARLDSPVFLAALMRRCEDLEVDPKTGMAWVRPVLQVGVRLAA